MLAFYLPIIAYMQHKLPAYLIPRRKLGWFGTAEVGTCHPCKAQPNGPRPQSTPWAFLSDKLCLLRSYDAWFIVLVPKKIYIFSLTPIHLDILSLTRFISCDVGDALRCVATKVSQDQDPGRLVFVGRSLRKTWCVSRGPEKTCRTS